jgi:hypothetical protein
MLTTAAMRGATITWRGLAVSLLRNTSLDARRRQIDARWRQIGAKWRQAERIGIELSSSRSSRQLPKSYHERNAQRPAEAPSTACRENPIKIDYQRFCSLAGIPIIGIFIISAVVDGKTEPASLHHLRLSWAA